MTDLATALQQVLRQVREEMKHERRCASVLWTYAHVENLDTRCDCDFAERVEAEQARRIIMAVQQLEEAHCYGYANELAGYFGAAQQERGSI